MHTLPQILPSTPQPAPALAVSDPPSANTMPTAFEPHCLMAWSEMVRGMDEMAGLEKSR